MLYLACGVNVLLAISTYAIWSSTHNTLNLFASGFCAGIGVSLLIGKIIIGR
jgi:hypothetical protein